MSALITKFYTSKATFKKAKKYVKSWKLMSDGSFEL